MSDRKILAYVALVDLLAVAAFVALFDRHVEDPTIGTFLLATLVALAGATPVRLPGLRTTVTATDPFVFTALAAFGAMPACVVAVAGVLGSALGRDRTLHVRHVAFNLGNVVLSTAAGSIAYLGVGGVPGASVGAQIGPLLAAATFYFLVNTGLVAGAVTVDTGRALLATWRESSVWTAISSYAGLTLSAGLLYLLAVVGPSGLALGVPVCWLLAAFYRAHRERQEAQRRRIEQIQELNQQLEDKVAERTAELQRALSHLEQANIRLRVANERLTEANRAKNEFLANISHELRTPLNAIIGFSDLLRDPGFGGLGPEQEEFAQDIHQSGEHLLRMINDILDLAKIEAGRLQLHRRPTDVARASRDAVAMLRPQATKKGITLQVRSAEDVGAAELDPGMYRQILVNLVGNAVKFTPEGGEVRVTTRGEGTDLLTVVEDTGIGIAQEDLPRVFEEFFQVDGSYARNYGGTGLGLALVKRMVGMHGGRIELDSEPGRGSRFTVRLPSCLLPAHAAPAAKTAPAPRPVRQPCTNDAAMILVVEDDPVSRKLARNVLRSRGYRVVEAENGEQALRLARREPVRLVLLDIQLPDIDGLEVARRLRRDPRTAGLPVVALSAHARTSDQERARQAGCSGYITKPIRLAEFPQQIESYLDPAPVG